LVPNQVENTILFQFYLTSFQRFLSVSFSKEICIATFNTYPDSSIPVMNAGYGFHTTKIILKEQKHWKLAYKTEY